MAELGKIGVQSIVLAQDGHDGFVVLHLGEMQLNKIAQKAIARQIHVEGLVEVVVSTLQPTITILVARKSNGDAMDAEELKTLATSFWQALSNWATSWSTEEFIEYSAPAETQPAWAVYSD